MITDIQLTIKKLQALADDTSLEHAIKDQIGQHDIQDMEDGEAYYHGANSAIMDKSRTYWKDGSEQTDETKPNTKMPHGWHKILVDQKTSYLFGQPVVIKSENEEFTDKINEHLDEDFDDTLQEISKEAGNKGVGWIHVYIDEAEEGAGEFRYLIIPAQEIIPVWDSRYQTDLEAVIRYYYVWQNGQERKRVEYWSRENVLYFIEADSGELVPDAEDNEVDEEGNYHGQPHFQFRGAGAGWGRVPFIPFKNNEELKNDLTYYKALVDEYDFAQSNHSDQLKEIQDIIWVLKNYQGESLQEFVDNLRYYKALKVDGEGGAEIKHAEIPSESKERHLDRVEDDIFLFGQGVNVKTDKFGQSPSGVALKFMYSLLDMKANITERKFQRALKTFLWFLREYLYLAQNSDYRKEPIEITFNKTMIMNELEKAQIAQVSKGIISDETVIANHPWTTDSQKEMERMEEQMNNLLDQYYQEDVEDGSEE